MTQGERAVLKAVELLAETALNECRMGSRLQEAARAYRRSLESKPRYTVEPMDCNNIEFAVVDHPWRCKARSTVARCSVRADAERIANLLNKDDQ